MNKNLVAVLGAILATGPATADAIKNTDLIPADIYNYVMEYSESSRADFMYDVMDNKLYHIKNKQNYYQCLADAAKNQAMTYERITMANRDEILHKASLACVGLANTGYLTPQDFYKDIYKLCTESHADTDSFYAPLFRQMSGDDVNKLIASRTPEATLSTITKHDTPALQQPYDAMWCNCLSEAFTTHAIQDMGKTVGYIYRSDLQTLSHNINDRIIRANLDAMPCMLATMLDLDDQEKYNKDGKQVQTTSDAYSSGDSNVSVQYHTTDKTELENQLTQIQQARIRAKKLNKKPIEVAEPDIRLIWTNSY